MAEASLAISEMISFGRGRGGRFTEFNNATNCLEESGGKLHHLFEDTAASLDRTKQEGFVVRIADAFLEAEMPVRMGKYVRDNHVQSETHWMQSELIANRLANS